MLTSLALLLLWRSGRSYLPKGKPQRFVSRSVRRVLILTDHSGLPFALNSGYGRSEAYNEVCARLANDMPWLSVRAAHIPGGSHQQRGDDAGRERTRGRRAALRAVGGGESGSGSRVEARVDGVRMVCGRISEQKEVVISTLTSLFFDQCGIA